MEAGELSEMLKVLKEHGVAAFRTKNGEDSFLEIVFKDSVPVVEEIEEPDIVKPVGPYSGNSIGLKFESFEAPDND